MNKTIEDVKTQTMLNIQNVLSESTLDIPTAIFVMTSMTAMMHSIANIPEDKSIECFSLLLKENEKDIILSNQTFIQ